MEHMSPLLRFLSNQIPDINGRFLRDIWEFDHSKLEYTHNFIQWIFPLDVRSKYHISPILTAQDRLHFSQSDLLKANQQKSLDVMLDFWGMKRDGLHIVEKDILTKRQYPWLKPYDHNQLRMTRAMRSLMLCNQPELAEALQQALLEISAKYGNISPKSLEYWHNALAVEPLPTDIL